MEPLQEKLQVPLKEPLACITAPALGLPGVRHGFFTRQGGVSAGVYASLNGGVGSNDDPACVRENRARMAASFGIAGERLLVPYQIHSADALHVDTPWADHARPRCDGLVTATPGLALGVTGADCGMLLFADSTAGVIGACHAGWKGALTGILEATLTGMEKLGASRHNIHCALGPMIAQASYEVGSEFLARFIAASVHNKRFFSPSPREGHAMFDLPAYIAMRLQDSGVGSFSDPGLDTYADSGRFYSYRRSVHRTEPDYGRLVSAIVLV